MVARLSRVLVLGFCLVLVAAGASAQGKPGTFPTVYLDVTIHDGTEHAIEGDGDAYPHGAKGITAMFNSEGELIFRIDPKATKRRVWFAYPIERYKPEGTQMTADEFDADPPIKAMQATTDWYAHSTSLLTTVAVNRTVDSWLPLQNLWPVGTAECVQLQWGYADGAKTFWSHNFHRPQSAGGIDGIDVSQTSYAVVTCVDGVAACTTWEVEPRATDGPDYVRQCDGNGSVPSLARLIDTPVRGEKNNSGLYLMPFKLTLTRK